jgi:hypothetical protein
MNDGATRRASQSPGRREDEPGADEVNSRAMRRRKLLVALAGLAVVIAVATVVLWPRSSSRITRENFARIKQGMSRGEVEAILGTPGDYRTGTGEDLAAGSEGRSGYPEDESVRDGDWLVVEPDGSMMDSLGPRYVWISDTAQVQLRFDEDGRLIDRSFDPRRRLYQPPLENLLWRAKRQWHRWFPE